MHKKLTLAFLAVAGIVTCLLSTVPGHNGDLGFYIACALERDPGFHGDALRAAEQILQKELPAAEFAEHAHRLESTAPALLDYYRIKPMYIGLVYLIHRLGISYLWSTILPSLVAYWLICCIIWLWSSRIFPPERAFVVSILLMGLHAATVLARLSSPDALSNAIILTCLYWLYLGKYRYGVLVLLLISIGVRLDNLIPALVLTVAGLWRNTKSQTPERLLYYLSLIVFLTAAWLINRVCSVDAWWFRSVTYTQSFHTYLHQWAIYLQSLSASAGAILFIMAIVCIPMKPYGTSDVNLYWLAIIGLIAMLRAMLFPSFEDRFFTAYYLSAFLLLAERITAGRSKTLTSTQDRGPAA